MARRELPVVIGRIASGRAPGSAHRGCWHRCGWRMGGSWRRSICHHQGATPQTALARSLGVELSSGST